MVRKADEEFPELLKTVRSKVDRGITGNSISQLRRIKAGDLLIVINGGKASADKVHAEMVKSFGEGAKVWKLNDESPVEIRDLNGEATKEEVLGALTAVGEDTEARLVSLRRAFGGSQTAVVVLQSAAAKRLCVAGRLIMGLVYSRVRHTELPMRCVRCLALGHDARECTGIDRNNRCWRYGETGHLNRECTASTEAAVAFRAVLSGAPGRITGGVVDGESAIAHHGG